MRPMPLAVLASISLTAAAVAQQAKPVTSLEQGAAAVSGSAGGTVYVVICDNAGTFKILGSYTTAAEAKEVADAKGVEQLACFVEGPYTGQATYAPPQDTVVKSYGAVCKKGPDSECLSDTSKVNFFPLASIARVEIVYHLTNGGTASELFDPRKVEAIFFTMPSVDRVLMSYDVARYGLEGALQRRRQIEARIGRK